MRKFLVKCRLRQEEVHAYDDDSDKDSQLNRYADEAVVATQLFLVGL